MANIKRFEVKYFSSSPHGLSTYVNRDNPIFTAYYVPRDLLNEAKSLPGVGRSGIYFLIAEYPYNPEIYVGETSQGIIRLDDHNRNKLFWNKAILFLSENFSLDTIHGLEVYALKTAKERYKYSVVNDVTPKYSIKSEELLFVKQKFDEIEFLLDFLVNDLFTPVEAENPNRFMTSRRGIVAFGMYIEKVKKFLVLPNSQIDLNVLSKSEAINSKRQEYLNNGNIRQVDGKFILCITEGFSSPSSAAEFVLGGSCNGWIEWRNKDGKTLDEVIRKK